MFLTLFALSKNFFTSPARRLRTTFVTNFLFFMKHKKLSIRSRWAAGRNHSGRVVFRTRTSKTHRSKLCQINYNFRYKKLGLVSSIKLIPFKNKILSLVFFNNGCVSYFLAHESVRLFTFTYLGRVKQLRRFRIRSFFAPLFQVKKLSRVSCLELVPGNGAQYVRSPGTASKLIKLDTTAHVVLVSLPSGQKKSFSYYSFALLGPIAAGLHKRSIFSKAGEWRSYGFNSIVRGVAMNPVDHPHGGRTKSVKYPRTPWGKTTKFK